MKRTKSFPRRLAASHSPPYHRDKLFRMLRAAPRDPSAFPLRRTSNHSPGQACIATASPFETSLADSLASTSSRAASAGFAFSIMSQRLRYRRIILQSSRYVNTLLWCNLASRSKGLSCLCAEQNAHVHFLCAHVFSYDSVRLVRYVFRDLSKETRTREERSSW